MRQNPLILAGGIVSILLIGGGIFIAEHKNALLFPQHVIPTGPMKVSFEKVIVNGKTWPIKEQEPRVSVRGPRKYLQGASNVVVGTGNQSPIERSGIGIVLFLPESDSATGIAVAQAGLSIDDLTKKSLYPEIGYRTDLRIDDCRTGGHPYQNLEEYPRVPLIPRGPIILAQRIKHLTLKGTFDIPPTAIPADPYMICNGIKPNGKLIRNPAPPATIEVRGIHIDIDSNLIFRWCGKGGPCHKL